MDAKDQQELAKALSELYQVVESLIEMLKKQAPTGVNTPIQRVESRMREAKQKTGSSLRRLTGNPANYP